MLELKDIHKSYFVGKKKHLQEIPILKWISLEVRDGTFLAIMGPSWSGKSTLMNIIGMLDTPTSGHYSIDGIRVDSLKDTKQSKIRWEKIGFIFQNYSLIPRLSNIEQVMLPLLYQGIPRKKAHEKAFSALERVGLSHKANNSPSELSGGQRQRVSIARAIVIEPSLLLADEPTWALDSKTGKEILDIFQELHAKWNTIIMITHDPEVANYAEKTVHIRDWLLEV